MVFLYIAGALVGFGQTCLALGAVAFGWTMYVVMATSRTFSLVHIVAGAFTRALMQKTFPYHALQPRLTLYLVRTLAKTKRAGQSGSPHSPR